MTTQTIPTTQFITEVDFFNLVMGLIKRGTVIVSFHSTTDARLKKTGNPFGDCTKQSHVNGILGYIYENSVNNQREREAKANGTEAEKFVAQPRKWGVRLNRAFVLHNGHLYITVKVERSLEPPRYFDEKGNELSKEQVEPFLPKQYKSTTQDLEKEVITRDYGMNSFDSIKVNGIDYLILHEQVDINMLNGEYVEAK